MWSSVGHSAINEPGVYMMPMNCSELLPDNTPFTNFYQAVARAAVATDKAFAKRVLRLLALRDKIADTVERSRELNPVDTLLRKTVCFYRETKDPLRPVPFDDNDFIQFLKGSLKDLEVKVEDAVFQVEFEKYQRTEYERRVGQNQSAIQSLNRDATREAENSFERLSQAAKRKVRAQ